MKRLLFLNCIAFCLAQDLGNFQLQSQLTTFSNTLVDQTIYVLPSDDTGTFLPSSSTALDSNGPTSSPIVSNYPTFTSQSPASSTVISSSPAPPFFTSPSPASSIVTSSSPAPPFFTSSNPASPFFTSSSPAPLTTFSPSLIAPTITTTAPMASSLPEISSTSSGCSALEITQFFTEEQTSYLTLLTTQVVEVTVTSRFYPNTTSSSLPADSSTSFSSTIPSSTAVPSPVESLCGNAVTTITRTVYKVEDVQSILFDVALPPLYGAYETSVNGTPVLYIHQLATKTPVWPYHYNGFPVHTMTASNQPSHQIVPSPLATGSSDFTTAFSTNPPFAQATSAYSNGAPSSTTSSGEPSISLVSEASLLPVTPMSTSLDSIQSDTTNLINPSETSLVYFSTATPSTSSLVVTSLAQPANVFSSAQVLPTVLSNSDSHALSSLSNLEGDSSTSTVLVSYYSTGWPIPALSSARTVQLSHISIKFASSSTLPSTDSLPIPTSSYASVSSAASSSSTSSHFGGYDCTDVNGNDDSLLLCKKNGQSRAKPMPVGMQAILYCFVLLFLTM